MANTYVRLKDIREDLDMTQQQIANIIGISRSTYAGWENEIDYIPLEKFNILCNILDINMDYIVGISNIKHQNIIKKNLNKIEIGKKLKTIRKENNDNQETTSNIIGIDQSSYSKKEKGKNFIQTALLITFCKHYKVSMDYICGRSDNKEIQNK